MKKLFIILFGALLLTSVLQTNSASGCSYCPAADSIFTFWISIGHGASTTYKDIVNNVISAEISAGEWYNKDFFYGEFAEDTTQALTDWRHPYTRMASTEKYYVGAFIANVGWKGNGAGTATTGFRINLHYNAGDGGTYNFTQNNNSFGYYCAEHLNETKTDISALDASASGIELYSLVTSFSVDSKNNENTVRSVANYTNKGLVACERTASNAWEITKWGYDMYGGTAKPTDVSSVVANIPWYEFCRNTNGTKTVFSAKKHSYCFAGSGCDIFKFNSIVEQYALIPLGIAPTTRYIINGNSWSSNGTWIKKFMANNGYNYDLLVRALSGNTTPQLLADAQTKIFPFTKSYLTREVYDLQEFTNDFVAVSSNWQTAYAHALTYLDSANNYFPSAEFVLCEMPPRKASSIDTMKWKSLNMHIDSFAHADGYSRTVPVSKNYVIGKEWNVLNTAEYLTDQLHLVTTTGHGYNIYGDICTDSIK